MFVNRPADPVRYGFDFIDFVFTVYSASYALENNININCGAKHCLTCLKCYKGMNRNKSVIYINEILKEESKYYYKELSKRNK